MAFNILVVDDSSIVRKVLIKTIGMAQLEVQSLLEAENGQEALDILRQNWVDLIFLDINMPIMNGIQFLEHLRKDESLCKTPVIIVSTEGSNERIEQLKELGIQAYLRKPTTPEDVTRKVREVLLGEN